MTILCRIIPWLDRDRRKTTAQAAGRLTLVHAWHILVMD
jgi:hypothetical protein